MNEGNATQKTYPFFGILGVSLAVILAWFVGSVVDAAAQVMSAGNVLGTWQTSAAGWGLSGWVAEICSSNSLLYGLVVIIVMAALGSAFGFAMDLLIRRTGIDLGRLKHHE